MAHYKLVALDMDGTLLNEEKNISDENARWIQEAGRAGIAVCFSTGRGFLSALPYAEQLKLDTPMVTVNGSEIWARPHMLHNRTLMDWEHIKRLRELAVQYDTWYWAYSVEGIYNKDMWVEDERDKEWLKFGFYTDNDEARSAVLDRIGALGAFEVTNSHPHNIELNPQGISKASGLAQVCELLGIDMSSVVAVGDSLNDIAMIRSAGLGIAMGNAQDEVKRMADAVVLSNDEDGVAQAIREYVLKA
ncbi:Cof-type HAD-IIB family hydrolase [Paenibacillus alkalitolerans]|uniref:Cof-type HAD-IIB family hydrolase n=1 Tax=Paenibacillus alkalitolerans TaxID=2799335 RepID=UPI0018F66099|nr:Cof-type HAD-IIB family hydrolase [Paenibacillus alkalitolerans]